MKERNDPLDLIVCCITHVCFCDESSIHKSIEDLDLACRRAGIGSFSKI
jgi:hypothetical protein